MPEAKNENEEGATAPYAKVWIIVPFSHLDADFDALFPNEILEKTPEKDPHDQDRQGPFLRRLRGETKAFAKPVRDFLQSKVQYFTVPETLEKRLKQRTYWFKGKTWVGEHCKAFGASDGDAGSAEDERKVPFKLGAIWGAAYPNNVGFLVFELESTLAAGHDGAAPAHWAMAVNECLRAEISCFPWNEQEGENPTHSPTRLFLLQDEAPFDGVGNGQLPAPLCAEVTTFKDIIDAVLPGPREAIDQDPVKLFRSDRFPAITVLNTHNVAHDIPCNLTAFDVEEAEKLLLCAKAFGPGHEVWCDKLPEQASTTELQQIEREGVAFWFKHALEESFRYKQFPNRIRYGYINLMLMNLYQHMMIQELNKDLSELTLGVDAISSKAEHEDPDAHDKVIRELSNTRLRIASFLLRESFPEPSILTRHANFYHRYRAALGIPGLAEALSEYAREIDQLSEIRRQTESNRNTEKMTAHREKTEKGLFVMTVAAESSAIPYYSNRAFYYIGGEVFSMVDEKCLKTFAAVWSMGFTAVVLGVTLYLFRGRIKEWWAAFFSGDAHKEH